MMSLEKILRRRRSDGAKPRTRRLLRTQLLESRRLTAQAEDLLVHAAMAESSQPIPPGITRDLQDLDRAPRLNSVQSRAGLPFTANFQSETITEGTRGAVNLTISRHPRDIQTDLVIRVTGGDPNQLPIPSTIMIPAGKLETVIRLTPTDDTVREKPVLLHYTFTSVGKPAVTASITLMDDDRLTLQNPRSPHDVNNDGQTTALDALQVINALSRPMDATGSVETYPDVNGDDQVTALDALMVINQLAR